MAQPQQQQPAGYPPPPAVPVYTEGAPPPQQPHTQPAGQYIPQPTFAAPPPSYGAPQWQPQQPTYQQAYPAQPQVVHGHPVPQLPRAGGPYRYVPPISLAPALDAPPRPPSPPLQPGQSSFLHSLNKAMKKADDSIRRGYSHVATGGPREGSGILSTAFGKLQTVTTGAISGYTKVWRSRFAPRPDETLIDAFACSLQLETGPIPGMLFIGNLSIAFCSDSRINFVDANNAVVLDHYKVFLTLHTMAGVEKLHNPIQPNQKFVHVMLADQQQLWFTAFVSFDQAFQLLQRVVASRPAAQTPH
eukprot:jgi/Chlat1/6522/Chrsp45S06003